MRTWIGTGITSTMRSTRTWDCRWGVAWSRVPVSGSSNSASRASGCGGVRTVSTISCTSGSPGSTDALRLCSVWPCPRTCKCAQYIVADLNVNALVKRFYINTNSNASSHWNVAPLNIDLNADQYQSVIGRIANGGIDGMYSGGTINDVAQLIYCPLYNI